MKSLIATTLLFSSALAAQEVKPKPHVFFDRENITLFSADALVRSMDAQSTRRMMSDPCHCFEEKQLPKVIAGSTPAMYAYSLGVSAGLMGISYLAHKTGHHKIERLIPMIDIVVDGRAAVGNYTLSAPKPKISAFQPLPVR